MTTFDIDPDCTDRWFLVRDERPNPVAYEWCVVDTNQIGSVQFSSPRGKETWVRFLAPGNYCIYPKGTLVP